MQIIIKSGNTDHTQRTLAAKILAIALPVSLLLPITFQNIVIFLGLAVLLLSQASLFKHRIVFPFYLFLGVAVFTSLVSPTHFTGIVNLKSFIWDVLLLFVLGIFLRSREKERVYLSFLYATLIIVGITLLLYLFIPSALSPVLNRKGLLTGFLGGRLTYAGVISFLLPLFSVKEVGDNKKLIWIAAFILILSIAYNLSRSYYLAVSVFFLFMVIFAGEKRLRIKSCLLFILFILVIFLNPHTRKRAETVAEYSKDRSASLRLELWKTGLKIFQKYPFTGLGYETWHDVAEKYIEKQGTYALKEYNKDEGIKKALSGHFHSDYIQMLVNGGIPLFLAFLFLIFYYGWILIKKNKYIKLTGIGLIIIFLASGFFEYNFGDAEVAHTFFFLLGFLIAH